MLPDALRSEELAVEERHPRRGHAKPPPGRRKPEAYARHRAALGAELELEDVRLLDRLLALGVTPETAPAFEALPLLEVAWADGSIDPEERWRVLASATAFGLELGRPAHAQLDLWLSRRPPEVLFEAWRLFAALRLSRSDAAARARRVLEEARAVAAAAGGVLGFGLVSRAERVSLERITAALAGDAPLACSS